MLKRENGFSLRKLVHFSESERLINRAIKRDFENILDLRNLFVHHNAMADRNCTITIGSISITLKEDEAISITKTKLLEILYTAIETFHRWNVELAMKYGSGKI